MHTTILRRERPMLAYRTTFPAKAGHTMTGSAQ